MKECKRQDKVLGKNIPGERGSKRKGPEIPVNVACWKNKNARESM